MLKSYARELAPVIVAIVNISFETSQVPAELKYAHIKPRLKKPSLDPELLNNHRPVSNLSHLQDNGESCQYPNRATNARKQSPRPIAVCLQ